MKRLKHFIGARVECSSAVFRPGQPGSPSWALCFREPPSSSPQQHPSLWDKGTHREPAGSPIHSLATLELPGSSEFSGYLDIPVPAARASAGLSPIRNPGLRAGMMERLGWYRGIPHTCMRGKVRNRLGSLFIFLCPQIQARSRIQKHLLHSKIS